MIQEQDALLFLDLDKQGPNGEAAGGRRLDARSRSAWLQFQALRALALEAAPEASEKLLREALKRCRALRPRSPLESPPTNPAQGRSEESAAARPAPNASPSQVRHLPRGLTATLAVGVLGTVWLAFHLGGSNWGVSHPALSRALGSTAPPADLPFEFPLATSPVAEALAEPGEGDSAPDADADDVHAESPVERQASRLVREQLHSAERRDTRGAKHRRATKPKGADSKPRPPGLKSRPPSKPIQTVSSAVPKPVPSPKPHSAGLDLKAPTEAAEPAFTLASDELWSDAAAAPLSSSTGTELALRMPSRQDIDVRLFSGDGKSLRVLAAGTYGPGTVHFSLTARDDQGKALPPGSYYLRVMTPWFSRVEPIQIH